MPNGRALIESEQSRVKAAIEYSPKKRGLMRHRTYDVNFEGAYVFRNPTRIPQTLFVMFPLPDTQGLRGVQIMLDGKETDVRRSDDGSLEMAVEVAASSAVELKVVYQTNGTDAWLYQFPHPERVRDFELFLKTTTTLGRKTRCARPRARDSATWAFPYRCLARTARPVGRTSRTRRPPHRAA